MGPQRVVKPQWPSRRGFTQQPESPNEHIWGSRPSNITKIQQEDLQEREREERKKIVTGRGKKNAKFWAPHPSRTLRGPTLRRHVGLKRHWPEQVKPKQVNTFSANQVRPKQVRHKQVNLAQSGIGLKRYWPKQVKRAGLKWFALQRPHSKHNASRSA